MKKGGLYIHVPFCKHKCIYCDFYTAGSRIADWNKYISSILNELYIRGKELTFIPDTLYIGGGTPSLIPPLQFKRLIDGINSFFGGNNWKEFTIEVNPEDVNQDNIEIWNNNGVNRVSLGIQTLNDLELQTVGRQHCAADAKLATNLLIQTFGNVSVDIMFGIPGQTLKSYTETLLGIIDLNPCHVSSYSLMLEDGTAMTLLARQKKIILPQEEEWISMFETTTSILKNYGYKRYEISNYARDGFESHHNLGYWQGKPYLGLGPGAHSFDGVKTRTRNINDLKGYLNHFIINKQSQEEKFCLEEILDENELREEMIMTRLRTSKGLNINEFAASHGEKQKEILLQKAKRFISYGLMKENQNFIKFTDKGFIVSDSILSTLI